jgi:hypothetical protein
VILFLAGLVWLVLELFQARTARGVVVEEPAPVVRERTYRDPRV